jgi:hypothetical protein
VLKQLWLKVLLALFVWVVLTSLYFGATYLLG